MVRAISWQTVADGGIAFDLIFLGKHDFLGKDDFLGKYRGRTPLFAWFDPLRETLFVLYSVASPASGLLRTRLLI